MQGMPKVAPSANDTESGNSVTRSAFNAMYSAAVPIQRPLRWPLYSHTRLPSQCCGTIGPTASTTPAPSLQVMTRGYSIGGAGPRRR